MAKIKGNNTRIEIVFRKLLFKNGIRYFISYPLEGKPDITIPSKKTAIFIDGCFWHQHKNCKLAYMPKSNVAFWKHKLTGNVKRDKKVNNKLKKLGWKVVRVFECAIKKDPENTVKRTIKLIKHNK